MSSVDGSTAPLVEELSCVVALRELVVHIHSLGYLVSGTSEAAALSYKAWVVTAHLLEAVERLWRRQTMMNTTFLKRWRRS